MLLQILGGSGFIGSHLCELFRKSKKKFDVLDIKNSEFFPKNFIYTDIVNLKMLKKNIKSNSTIINLAAIHSDNHDDIKSYYNTNVKGAKNICLIAKKKKINKMIFISSVAVYGFAKNFCDEDGQINPYNHYGKSKFLAEKVYLDWQSEKPLKRSLVIIRPTVVFGERNRGNVYNLFKQIHSNFFFMIGNGRNIKSLAYVGNLTSFINYCLNFRNGARILNYVDKPQLSMNNLVMLIKLYLKKNIKTIKIPYLAGLIVAFFFDLFSIVLKKKMNISSLRVKKFVANSCYLSKYSSELKFKPNFNLRHALKKTINYEFK